jgi:hypothetical protein
VWDPDTAALRPVSEHDDADPSLGRCIDCHGERYGPNVGRYQQFKRALTATLADVWELTDREIVDWSLDQT